MNEKNKFKIPIHMIILDLLGATLAVLGLVEWFTDLGFIPEQFKFDYYDIALVICGILLMIPMHLHIFRFVITKSSSNTN